MSRVSRPRWMKEPTVSDTIRNPFNLAAEELQRLLAADTHPFPELQAARGNLEFVRDGDRGRYETPYFLKRTNLAAAALRLFLGVETGGEPSLLDVTHDYLWSICEESSWVLPAHEHHIMDLFAAETGFVLAETLHLLGATLDAEVRHRVRAEIERRICD